ncbi:OPT oligopeptide transporter protein-domain-containing protein [Pseudomassariella vexata]|uniref:OPT oligopeptide transporter protein-domain-containing protein n=1 Tax=Pseudomassariella vexata TaxID=1141098 RepID=A0A1Y2ECL7_9PEZI|nr:OPT oligopeptide transporter protein-domain-containing protein [Pseudomassariella vexata]ORY68575.1 OPT oligopeptide transporter protein-domain-containing protein [Pseudomassariella vexata]
MAHDATRIESLQGRYVSSSSSTNDVDVVGESAAVTATGKSARKAESDVEKPPFLFTVGNGAECEEEAIPEDDARVATLPAYVRRVVSLTDNPDLPVFTFRYFVLALLFVIPGAFLSMMSHFRTTSAPYSIFFVQIACSYVGDWWAKTLPGWHVCVPGTKWGFSLNPGPFSVKEHVLVVLTAASGATYNLGYTPISMAELYFNETVHPALAIFFMWGIVWTGYSFAAIARQFLIYDPQYPWFQALCQTALFETQKKQRDSPSPQSRKQTKVFWLVLIAVILWQFLPEYVFPMLGSMALLCWVAPNNPTANFIGAGFGGMGLLNLSFDWSTISTNYSIFLTPWWTQVVTFVAFVCNCWLLLPLAKWGGLGAWHHKLMSNRFFLGNGTSYPVDALLTPEIGFNETAYQELGPVYVGTQVLWGMFFDYAAYTSAIVWMALFGFKEIKGSFAKLWARRKATTKITEQYHDQLNIIQRSYPEVPAWWFLALFAASFVSLLAIVATNSLYIPVYTYFVAVATGAIMVVPLGWLYALSNFQLPIGTVNELLYGIMVNAVSGHKNPAGATVYSSIAGNAWYRAQYNLQDMKIGHFMHMPPRAVFFSQIFGSLIGIPINYGVVRWILTTKRAYLTGGEVDPTHQWTAQSLTSNLTMGVQYVLIGPLRLFQGHIYTPVPYGFLVGALAPLALWLLHKKFPKMSFNLFNTTIFFSHLANFYGNISTGYVSSFLGGFFVMYWAYRKRYELWARWNYILAAAFDAGFNFNMLLIFLFFGSGKVTTMPNWWGNEVTSSERCFALDSE